MNGQTIQVGETINGTYQILRQIGKGGSGVVYLGYHMHLRKNVVLKRVFSGVQDPDRLRTESDILKNLHHPSLPQVYDFLVRGRDVFTVMDYIEGNDYEHLKTGSGNIPEAQMLSWLRQMAEVLVYLHTNRPPVIHSDIKPANVILRPDGTICLIDFNISLTENDIGKVSGYSINFASPEQIELAQLFMTGQPAGFRLDGRTDIYSAGALFYYMMTGILPKGISPAPKLSSMGDIGYSPALCAVVDRCMEWNRERRYRDAKELLKAVTDIRKQDVRYRRYVALRICSWALSALLISGGFLMISRGIRQRITDGYQAAYSRMADAIEQDDMDAAEKAALSILNNEDYQRILKRSPKEAAQLYHSLGDVYYSEENYSEAASYYGIALARAKRAVTGSDLAVYYRDRCIALSLCGRTDDASEVIDEARSDGITDDTLYVMQAAIALGRKDKEACERAVREYLKTGGQYDRRAQACEIASRACAQDGDTDAQISWLEKAVQYAAVPSYQRELGAAYMSRAASGGSGYALKAQKIYKELAGGLYPQLDDELNLAIVDQYLGQWQDSISVLRKCGADPKKDYRVSMYLSFAYEALGDEDSAARYSSMAYSLERKLGSSQLSGADPQALDNLEAIYEKYR